MSLKTRTAIGYSRSLFTQQPITILVFKGMHVLGRRTHTLSRILFDKKYCINYYLLFVYICSEIDNFANIYIYGVVSL